MLYPYMTIENDLEMLHSHLIHEDGNDTVYVQFEKPIDEGFKTGRCKLPTYEWSNIENFTANEIQELEEIVRHHAHLIYRYAECGGIQFA